MRAGERDDGFGAVRRERGLRAKGERSARERGMRAAAELDDALAAY